MYHLPSNISRDNRVSIVAVATLLMLLVSAIPFSMAAAITVTTDKTSYQTGDLITVSGEAPPGDSVVISVSNPSGNLVGACQVDSIDTDGAYTCAVVRFPKSITAVWKYGDYTVKSTAAAAGKSAESTITFEALAAQEQAAAADDDAQTSTGTVVAVAVDGTYAPGDSVTIHIFFKENGVAVEPQTWQAKVFAPGSSSASNVAAGARNIQTGYKQLSVSAGNDEGTYFVHVTATTGSGSNSGQASFQVATATVNEVVVAQEVTRVERVNVPGPVVTEAADISHLEADVDAIADELEELEGNLQSVQSNLDNAVSNAQYELQASVDGISADTAAAAAGAEQAASTALVAAAVAALAVVLEIAILVRANKK